jgi:hypothetical protein
MFEDDPQPPTSIDLPPTSIDPDSIPGRLTLIEERLKAMSIELDSLKAVSIELGSLRARTARRRRRAITKQQTSENIVKIGLAAVLMFVLALFLLYAELAPWPDTALAPSPTVVPPVSPSTTPEPDSHF